IDVSESVLLFFFFQAEDGIRDRNVTGVQTCALPIYTCLSAAWSSWFWRPATLPERLWLAGDMCASSARGSTTLTMPPAAFLRHPVWLYQILLRYLPVLSSSMPICARCPGLRHWQPGSDITPTSWRSAATAWVALAEPIAHTPRLSSGWPTERSEERTSAR